MTWQPAGAHFALVPAPSTGLPEEFTLLVADDFAEIVERRVVLQRYGVDLRIVWGCDGRPVSKGHAALLLPHAEEISTFEMRSAVRTVDGNQVEEMIKVEVRKLVVRAAHPKTIRPESKGQIRLPPAPLPSIEGVAQDRPEVRVRLCACNHSVAPGAPTCNRGLDAPAVDHP